LLWLSHTGCHVYLCDFHRKQAWQRWLRSDIHGVSLHREELFDMMERCATAATAEAYSNMVDQLTQSNVWKTSVQLREWFTKQWLSAKEVVHIH